MFKTIICKFMLSFSLFLFLFCINMNSTFANTKEKVTETLDLTAQETIDNLENFGWAWNNDTKTLILRDATFEMTDDSNKSKPCIKFSTDKNITVVFEGVNNLKAQKNTVFLGVDVVPTAVDGTETGTITFKGSSYGVLNLGITEISGKGGDNLGTTFNDVHNINFESGTINSKGGILSDGIVTVSGGSLNIDTLDMKYGINTVEGIYAIKQVKIIGGNVDIKSSNVPINVAGMQGNLQDEDIGVIISGGNVSLSTQAAGYPVIYTGAFRKKDIIIDGGNITLAGDRGIYANQGIIYVNYFDSLNTENVKNEVFGIGSQKGNEIKYASADYSKVDEAIDRANKLNKDDYKDFSAVEEALALVKRDKNFLEQREVDSMAENINKAIESLELKNEKIPQETDKSDTNKDINNVETNNETSESNIDNPTTNDDILKYIIYFILSVIGLGFNTLLYKKNNID